MSYRSSNKTQKEYKKTIKCDYCYNRVMKSKNPSEIYNEVWVKKPEDFHRHGGKRICDDCAERYAKKKNISPRLVVEEYEFWHGWFENFLMSLLRKAKRKGEEGLKNLNAILKVKETVYKNLINKLNDPNVVGFEVAYLIGWCDYMESKIDGKELPFNWTKKHFSVKELIELSNKTIANMA